MTNLNNNQTTSTTTATVFIKADEISQTMGVSRAYAYRVIKQLNTELSGKGYLVVQGRTSRQYFYERIYGKAC